MVNIVQIIRDFLAVISVGSIVNLRIASNARLYHETSFLSGIVIHRYILSFWLRADKTHISFQHVNKQGEAVKTSLYEPASRYSLACSAVPIKREHIRYT